MRTFVIEFQVTVVTKYDEMASGEIKKKTQLKMDEMRQERKKEKMHYALVIFASPVYFEIKFDYCNLLFKTKYNHE